MQPSRGKGILMWFERQSKRFQSELLRGREALIVCRNDSITGGLLSSNRSNRSQTSGFDSEKIVAGNDLQRKNKNSTRATLGTEFRESAGGVKR